MSDGLVRKAAKPLMKAAARGRFVERYGPWAVVTGASSGIGEETAKQLAALGLSYSRLWSARNLAADDLNQVDLAIGYRPHRVVAVGLVARAINMPRAHGDATIVPSLPAVVQPFELDPELALRPIRGTRALELAVGARIVPVQPVLDPRYALPVLSPRVRVEAGGRGVRVFAEGERYASATASGSAAGLRFMTGVEFDLANVGLAVAPSFGSGGGGAAGAPAADRAGRAGRRPRGAGRGCRRART